MGYACPVCEAPQADAEHLANHLAFTALLHGDGHEAWLDDAVPGWGEMGPDDLAPRVAERAPEAEYDEVFEDTAATAERPPGRASGRVPDDVAEVVEEARDLTRRMEE